MFVAVSFPLPHKPVYPQNAKPIKVLSTCCIEKKATNTYLGCITKKIYSNFNLPTFLLKHLSPFSLNPEIASEEKKRERERGGEILSPLCTFSQSGAQLFFPCNEN